MKKNGSYEKL